jgi:PAS domain S-box-containing protein
MSVKKSKKRPSMTRYLFTASVGLLLIGVLVMAIVWSVSEVIQYRRDVDRIHRDYTESKKDVLRNEIRRIIDYIEYEKARAEQELKDHLRDWVTPIAPFLHYYATNSEPAGTLPAMLKALEEGVFNERNKAQGSNFSVYSLAGETLIGPEDLPYKEKALALAASRENGYLWTTLGTPRQEGPLKGGPMEGTYLVYIQRIPETELLICAGNYISFTMKEIQKNVLKRIDEITFETNGYIFVTSYDGTILSNRAAPKRVGENMWDFSDPTGVKVVQRVIEAARSSSTESFIHYSWWKPNGDMAPKLSISRGVDDWGWAVGVGVYMDELEKELAELGDRRVKRALYIFLGIFALLTGVVLGGFFRAKSLSNRIKQSFRRFSSFFRKAADRFVEIDETSFYFSELRELAQSANQLVRKRNQVYSNLLEKEKKLEESEKKYREIVENANSAIIKLRSDGTILFVNEFAEKLFGYKQEEMVGKLDVETIVPPKDSEGRDLKALIKGILQDPKRYEQNENENVTKDGKKLWISWTNRPIFDDDRNPVGVLSIGTDKTEEKKSRQIIEQSLREKEVLLREIHHRVKNNLQIITSILNLQSGYIEDDTTKQVFLDCQNRVDSMAMVHEQLYQSDDLNRIDTETYINMLTNHVISSYFEDPNAVDFDIQAETLDITIDIAIPFALITVELLTNAVKYAAHTTSTRPRIQIDIHRIGKEARMVLSDNGPGLPEGLDWKTTNTLGLKLVRLLTAQIRGTVEVVSKSEGLSWQVAFPLYSPSPE